MSLSSGKTCAGALYRLGARVSRVDAGRDIAAVLNELKPDVCFNALYGECVQAELETLREPWTHSGRRPSRGGGRGQPGARCRRSQSGFRRGVKGP